MASLAACANPDSTSDAAPPKSAKQVVAAQLMAGLERDKSSRMIIGVANPNGAGTARSHLRSMKTLERFTAIPYEVVTVESADDLAALASDPDVTSIEPDTLSAPTLDVSTTVVEARTAWASGYMGQGYAVAVLDTGVLKSHTHLAGKVIAEACYSSNDSASGAASTCPAAAATSTASDSGLPCSVSGCDHGTHVAAIVGSSNATYPGVAKGANLIAIQVFTKFTSSTQCGASSPCVLAYASDWLKGLQHVYDLAQAGTKIAAVNMSLGGGMYTGTCDSSFPSAKAAIDKLATVGIATVVAAGNDGYTNAVGFPGCISTAVTVGATTKTDGVPSYTNMSSVVDVVAPGSSITAAVPTSTTSVGTKSGTSMASPHVAGAFAVMRSAKPTMTVTEGLAALKATGATITDTRSGGTVSKPRIAIAHAIATMTSPTPASCTRHSPEISMTQPASVAAPAVMSFTALVTNRDSTQCGSSTFEVSGTVPTGWWINGGTPSVAPGATATVQVEITPPSDLRSSGTPIVFSATNISARDNTATDTAVYEMTCAHAVPVITLTSMERGAINTHIDNLDPATCSATAYELKVVSDLTLTPNQMDLDVEPGAGADVQLSLVKNAPAGEYQVEVRLARADGTDVGEETIMTTVTGDEADVPAADLGFGCSSTHGAGGLPLVLGALFVARRRRR